MPLLPDHLVIRVRDLKRAIADFAELGFTVQPGGTHAHGATHNALVGFADGSYLELIAFIKEAREHPWWEGRGHPGEGFVDFALRPESIASTVEAARARGVYYDGPIPGGRIRLDGTRLEWQTGRPSTRDLPFLCGDLTPRFLRVAEGDARKHRNGATGIATVNVAVADLDASIARYRALLGDVAVHRGVLTGYRVRFATLVVGATTLTLLSSAANPGDGDEADPPDASSLARDLQAHLANHGEGVFGASLRVAEKGQARPLPLVLAHGARLDLARI
jgi:catechol 2,3-dioxygenase-like lactoylglutathione lyase family enzyme